MLKSVCLTGVLWLGLVSAPESERTTEVMAAQIREKNLNDFDFVVEKIAANYAGFPTKVNDNNRAELDALTKAQREVAGAAQDDVAFSKAVSSWLGFFADQHVWLEAKNTSQQPSSTPRFDWTEDVVQKRLDELGAERRPVEGIWEAPGARYRIALLRNSDSQSFTGVVLATTAPGWAPGDLKAELRACGLRGAKGSFRMGDHSARDVMAGVRGPEGQILWLGGAGAWHRLYPPPVHPIAPERVTEILPPAPWKIEKLSERTMYVRVPDLFPAGKPQLDALLDKNRAAIDSSANLIIDLRENPGGWDSVFAPLIPWIYSRPTYQVAHEHRATLDNAAGNEALAADPNLTEENRLWLRGIAESMRAKPGEFIVVGGRAISVDTRPETLPHPERVGILIEGAASSAEQLILAAQQSRKVTLFGRSNSAGVVDFGNVRDLTLPSGRFTLRYATSRSARLPDYPIDGVGIAPDVVIPDDITDEVAFVREWLEKKDH